MFVVYNMKIALGALVVLFLVQAISAKPETLSGRITDGQDATPGQFPHQISLEFGLPPFLPYSHSCGGTILNEYFILTAGHCVSGIMGVVGKYRVKAGKHELKVDDEKVQTIQVVKKIIHEGYPSSILPKVAAHDIAIIKLESPLEFNEWVQPAKLPKQNSVQEGQATLSGWGSVSKRYLPKLPKYLQYADIPIVSFEACQAVFQKENANVKLEKTMLCTGPLGGSVSACSGDSGGPLVQYEDKEPVVIGVVSFGSYPCGTSGMPSVFTRVSSYVEWVEEQIKQNS